MALFSVSSSARYVGIFVVIVVVQENTWIYFSYLKFCVLTNIFSASSFPLPTLPLQLQHSLSVLFIWVRHSSIPQRSEILQHWSSCAGLSSPGVCQFTLVKVMVSPVWTLTSLCAYATFSLSVHLLVDLPLVLCLAFVNKTAVCTQSSCLFDRGFLYTHAQ